LGQEYWGWCQLSMSLISADIWQSLSIYVRICTEFMPVKHRQVSFGRGAWLCYSSLSGCFGQIFSSRKTPRFQVEQATAEQGIWTALSVRLLFASKQVCHDAQLGFFRLLGGDNFITFSSESQESLQLPCI